MQTRYGLSMTPWIWVAGLCGLASCVNPFAFDKNPQHSDGAGGANGSGGSTAVVPPGTGGAGTVGSTGGTAGTTSAGGTVGTLEPRGPVVPRREPAVL